MFEIEITGNMGQYVMDRYLIFRLTLSVISLGMFSMFFMSIIKKPIWRLLSPIVILTIYTLLLAYHFSAKRLFDWSVFADNAGEIFSMEAFHTIFHSLDTGVLIYWPILVVGMLCYDYKTGCLRHPKVTLSKIKSVFVLFIYLFIVFSPLKSYDPLVSLFRSMIYYYKSPISFSSIVAKKPNRTLMPTKMSVRGRPHIFLIVVESLNARKLSLRDKNGQPITPFLDQLANQSITVDYFYGNSIQTAKGHAAIFLSAMPSLKGKLSTKFKGVDLDSIFDYLKKENYRSLFYLAHNNMNFDNAKNYFGAKNLDDMVTVASVLKKEDEKDMAPWGIRDDRLMEYFFDFFDSYSKQYDQPIFTIIATIQSHTPFILPNHMRHVYPNAKTMDEHYLNCLNIVDKGIETFYKELSARSLNENAIVIVTADHAYPLGEHGITKLEAGYYEESYRIPFYLTAPGISPRRLKGAYSQVDIVPTILDLLNIPITNSMFLGQSIFSKNKSSSIFQIQPYEKQIGLVSFPIKYRYSIKTDAEYAYNLLEDPMERKNIISDINDDDIQQFQSEVRRLFEIQKYYQTQQY